MSTHTCLVLCVCIFKNFNILLALLLCGSRKAVVKTLWLSLSGLVSYRRFGPQEWYFKKIKSILSHKGALKVRKLEKKLTSGRLNSLVQDVEIWIRTAAVGSHGKWAHMGVFSVCSEGEDCCAMEHACAGFTAHWALLHAAAGERQGEFSHPCGPQSQFSCLLQVAWGGGHLSLTHATPWQTKWGQGQALLLSRPSGLAHLHHHRWLGISF